MATLTPGVLLKLLQSMNSDARVVGEHRSAVLQIIGIVPAAASAAGPADLWPSHGFYLQISDSLNSTYVSLSDSDADAILLNRPQLGHLVHLDRLHFDHPVPRASGLRPIPGRPLPFAGRPEPLVARTSLSGTGFLIAPAPDSAPPVLPRTVFAAKDTNSTPAVPAPAPAVKRRFSSPAAAKSSTTAAGKREPSPAARKARSRPSSPALAPRSASPVPAKCVVPSLVAAKEENRRVSREPSIIVPSRYRQPSPVAAGRKGAASPAARRGSGSPGRRLSIGMKGSPVGEGGKRRTGVVVAGISRVDALVGSARSSVRKSWEDKSSSSVESSESKEKGGLKSKVDHQAILRTQAAISKRLSDVPREPPTVEETYPNENQNTVDNTESVTAPLQFTSADPKFSVHDRKWTDGSIPFDVVSENIAKLGKEALQRRDIASVAAAEALEEALANESIIRSLSMFSDLCSTAIPGSPLSAIDRFLSIFSDVAKSSAIAESLAASRKSSATDSDVFTEHGKSTSLWVDAALATDIEILSLLKFGTEASLRGVVPDPRKRVYVAPIKIQPKILTGNSWTRGYGMSETVELARELRREMQIWFLRFVEEALDVGFRTFGDNSDRDSSKMAIVLSQLKKVNEWLDGVGKKPVEESMKEKIERLKRKIYGFVISNVGSAFDSSVSLS